MKFKLGTHEYRFAEVSHVGQRLRGLLQLKRVLPALRGKGLHLLPRSGISSLGGMVSVGFFHALPLFIGVSFKGKISFPDLGMCVCMC